MMDRIRVLLVDDHTLVRQGLRCILARPATVAARSSSASVSGPTWW